MSFKKTLAIALVNVFGGERLRSVFPDMWTTLQAEIETEYEGTMSSAQLETFKKMFPWADQTTLDKLAAPMGVVNAIEEIFRSMSTEEVDKIVDDYFRGK